jgi:hypothetical protein
MVRIELTAEEKKISKQKHMELIEEEEVETLPFKLQLLWMKIHQPEKWMVLETIY